MRLGIAGARDARSREIAEETLRHIRSRYPEASVRTDFGPPPPEVLVLVGDDRFLLEALRETAPETAVLTVGDGFLAEVPPDRAKDALQAVMKGRHWIETRLRLEVSADGKRLPPALNEVALGTRKGAGFLRYSLEVDGERVWRDGGDGVVICSPTGSTGYGLSAGGPVVMENAEALVVVPVCSADGQRPLVVPSRSTVAVTDIESRLGCDVVLDGSVRSRVRSSGFTVRASDNPARFVRLGEARYLRTFGKLRAKRSVPEVPVGAPPSAKFLFRLLSDQGPMTTRQITADSGLPERTVRNALAYLIREGLARRSPSLRDAREAVFGLRH
jgi:NAD+ kinase